MRWDAGYTAEERCSYRVPRASSSGLEGQTEKQYLPAVHVGCLVRNQETLNQRTP